MMSGEIPEAWPLLLTREQACAFLGGISEGTFLKVCPVPPIDLGANVVRYRRGELEAWVAALSHRLPKVRPGSQDAPPAAGGEIVPMPPANRPSAAVQRALERAKGVQGCRRSATSNG
jgi:hypothetical protein